MNEPLSNAFRFCPRCGLEAKDVGVNPFTCSGDECSFVFYFSPITAVGGIVTDSEGRVLFVRRANDPGKGKLGLPGGFVDAGEPLEDALIREVFEETNLKAVAIEYVTSFPNAYAYRGVTIDVTDMFFKCRVETFDGLYARDGEATGFHLTNPTTDVLNEMAFESNQRAMRVYLDSHDPHSV